MSDTPLDRTDATTVGRPSLLDDYEFDLRGFLVVREALSADDVASLNDAYDRFPELDNGEWYGNAQRRDYTSDTGFELHNLLDCGDPAFDVLIDHPSWLGHALHYAGEEGTYVQGTMIDEAIATIRTSGGHHPVHSGGHDASIRTQYGYRNGRFRCGQLNVLVALRDIGPGDGPTMIVPGSHKQNLSHPLIGDYARGDRMDDLPWAEPVYAECRRRAAVRRRLPARWIQPHQPRRAPGHHLAVRPTVVAASLRLHAVRRAARPLDARATQDPAADPTSAHGQHPRATRPALELSGRLLSE